MRQSSAQKSSNVACRLMTAKYYELSAIQRTWWADRAVVNSSIIETRNLLKSSKGRKPSPPISSHLFLIGNTVVGGLHTYTQCYTSASASLEIKYTELHYRKKEAN